MDAHNPPETCPRCLGSGKTTSDSLVFDASWTMRCTTCKGTGKARCVCPPGGAPEGSRMVLPGDHFLTCPFTGTKVVVA